MLLYQIRLQFDVQGSVAVCTAHHDTGLAVAGLAAGLAHQSGPGQGQVWYENITIPESDHDPLPGPARPRLAQHGRGKAGQLGPAGFTSQLIQRYIITDQQDDYKISSESEENITDETP